MGGRRAGSSPRPFRRVVRLWTGSGFRAAHLPRRGRQIAVALGGLAVVAAFWASLIGHLDRREAAALRETRGQLAALSATLDRQLARLVGRVDGVLRGAQEAFARDPQGFDAAAWTRRAEALHDLAAEAALLDARGRTMAESGRPAGAPPLDVGADPAFRALAAEGAPDGLVVDRAMRDPASGRTVIRLARRLARPDGSFAGAVTVGLDADTLMNELRALAMGETGCIALFGQDGYARARSPAVPDAYRENLLDTAAGQGLFRLMQASGSGTAEGACLSEPGSCLFAFVRLDGVPLSVVVGKSVSEALEAYQGERTSSLAVGASLSVLVLLLLAGLLAELERRRRREIEFDGVHRSLDGAIRALAEREAVLRGVIAGSADGIDVLDLDGRLRFIDRMGRWQQDPADPAAPGRSFADVWPEAFRAGIAAAVAQAAEGRQAQVQITLAAGAPRHLDLLIVPVADLNGRPEHLVAITRDVTHLSVAQAALAESEGRYRMLAQHATDMVVQCDRDGMQGYVSPAARDLLGRAPETLIGTSALDLVHPDDAPAVAAILHGLMRGPAEQATSRHRLLRADGSAVWIEARYSPIRDAAGARLGAVASCRDISESHAAAEALAQKTALLELTLDTMDQGLLMVDADGTVPVSNRRARELLGLPATLMAGRPTLAEVRRYQRLSPRWGSLADGVATWTLDADRRSTDVRTERRSDDNHFMDVRTVPIAGTGGLVQTFTDITDIRRAEETAREAEGLFRSLFDNSPDLKFVYRVAADGACVLETLNPPAALATGLDPAQARGRRLEAVLAPDAAARLRADIAHVVATGEVLRTEDELILPGSPGVCEVVLVPFRDGADARVGHVFVSVRDVSHLRAAEAAVREKTLLLEATLENMDQGLLMVDAGGRVLVCNPRATELLDLPPALMASRPSMREVSAYLERHGEFASLPDEIRTRIEPCAGEVGIHAYERTRPNGSVIEVRTAPLPGGGAVRTFTDITAVRQSETALRESEARYRLLADNASDVILLRRADPEGRTLYVSPACRSVLGYEPEEFELHPASWLIHPDDRAAVGAAFLRLSEGSLQATTLVHRLRHRDGRWVWVEAAYALTERRRVVDDTVAEPVMMGVVRDITGRRAAETALIESESRYRLLAANTSDIIVLGHADGRRSYVSPAVTPMLGYTGEEAARLRLRDIIHPGDAAAVFSATAGLTAAAPTASALFRLRHRDGHHIWAEAAFRHVDGGPDGHTIIAAVRDVTERQAGTEALKAARDVAELARAHADRANQAKTDFLAAMSHEIRTPLNAIIGFTGLMLDSANLPADARSHAENISGSGRALLTIINDILEFSEVEAGTIRLEVRPFAPLGLIENCLSIVQGLAVNKRLEFRSVIDPDLPAGLVGDEGRLRQILLNLLNNAVKFTRQGYVALGVRREGSSAEGDTLRFSVTDSGIGIPRDKQDRLFRNFSQVDGSIRREFGGTGLGLAITKRLVEMMGGQVGVFSEAGKGSTFWFTLTLPRSALVRPAAEVPVLPPSQRRGDLLLVEDVELNQKLARLILEAVGHRVTIVGDGFAAIEAAREGAFDLILMDVQMPGLDGMEVTRTIRTFAGPAGRVPIVAMTANVLPDQVRRFRAAGMDDHVAKPINRAELYAVIERWLPAEVDPSAPEQAQDGLHFDRAIFDQMVWLVGPEAARELVVNLRSELEASFAGSAATQADRDRLRREAHTLVPGTGMLGFRSLSEAAGALQGAADDEAFAARLQRIRHECDWALERTRSLEAALADPDRFAA